MKKYCLIALFGYMALVSKAQPFAVQAEKMNVLYVGMPNDMHIVVNDVPPERLILLPSMGKIDTIDLKSGYYKWAICKKDSSVAQLVLADSVRTNPIDTLFFRVKDMPEPIFYLYNQTCMGTDPLSILCYFNHPSFSAERIEILGYNVEFNPKNDVKYIKHNTGAKFETDIRNDILSIRSSGWIRFYGFRWKLKHGQTVYTSGQDFIFGKYPKKEKLHPFED